jgi:FKBP-type peptidyl-prolyl cis-trans isomerase
MYEAPAPPKKEIPYPWIVAGLSVLSFILLIVILSDGSTAAKSTEALVVSQSASAYRERLMQDKIDALTADHAAANRASGQLLAAAEKRIADLTAEVNLLRDRSAVRVLPAARAGLGKAKAAAAEPASGLLSQAMIAWGEGNLIAAKSKFEAILAADPNDISALDGLADVNSKIAERGSAWANQNEEYLVKLDSDGSVSKASSGLRYKIVSRGSGYKPKATSMVKCLYVGKFIDGIVFDSTAKRNNEPSEFPLDSVIPAWTEGLQYIGVGGKILLYAPPSLAYGSRRTGPIPPDSVLIFEIELVDITK